MSKINTVTLLIVLGAGILYISSFSYGNNAGSNNKKSTTVAYTDEVITPLSPILPYDVTLPPEAQRVLETTVRRSFDLFSWNSFIALSWPVQRNEVIGQYGVPG
jgi:hypothetical protein